MTEWGFFPWLFVVLIGAVILGAGIAYGQMRSRARTRAERAATERGTERLYVREDEARGS